LVDRYGEGQVFVCVCWWVRGVEWSGVGSVESGRAPVGRVGRHERAKAATRKPPRRRHSVLFMTGQPHGEVPVFNGPFVD
jgi:hypothetical protein